MDIATRKSNNLSPGSMGFLLALLFVSMGIGCAPGKSTRASYRARRIRNSSGGGRRYSAGRRDEAEEASGSLGKISTVAAQASLSAPAPSAKRPYDGRRREREYSQSRRPGRGQPRRVDEDDSKKTDLSSSGKEEALAKDQEKTNSGDGGEKESATLRRMIIYTAKLRVSVADVDESVDKAKEMVESMGGYMQSRSGEELVVRVPVTRFDEYIESLSKLGEIFRRRISSQDVTREYTDIAIRLKSAKVVLKRLQELLAKAKNVKEAMAVEKEIGRVVETIERMKGQLRYLEQHAALSTVTIRFVSPINRYKNRRPTRARRSPFPWIRKLGLRHLVNVRR